MEGSGGAVSDGEKGVERDQAEPQQYGILHS